VAAAVSILGQGVIAQLVDTVRVDDNEIESNAIVVQAAGLSIGTGLDSVCPANTVFGPGPLVGKVLEIDVNENLGWGVSNELCVRNDTDAPIAATLSVNVTSNTEVGACEASEASAGDTSCTAGAAGELVGAATLTRFSQCTDVETSGALTSGTTASAIGTLAPGQVCFANVFVELTGDPAIWQTDRATYDIVIQGA
jgi:hypothetical protein